MITDPQIIYRQLAEIASVNPEEAARLHQRYESWTTDPFPEATELDIWFSWEGAFGTLNDEMWRNWRPE